uniref:Cadherin domain-containing protein n=1 Tax=Anopheles merus TaxID=30066 RepID=A0A182V086_ANOME
MSYPCRADLSGNGDAWSRPVEKSTYRDDCGGAKLEPIGPTWMLFCATAYFPRKLGIPTSEKQRSTLWSVPSNAKLWLLALTTEFDGGHCNLPPVFTQDMNNLALSERTPVGAVVYKLEGYDPEGGNVSFGLIGSDNFIADPISGDVQVIKELDREEHGNRITQPGETMAN